MTEQHQHPETSSGEIEELASRRTGGLFTGLLGEYFDFLRFTKKWWLAPIIVVLLIFGVLVVVGGGIAAPFIYTLF